MEDLQIKNDMHITRSIEEIYGTVLANERDRSGDIIQIAVEDDNFQKYLVLNSKLARQLFDFVNERLFVYGQIVDEDVNGHPILSLSGFIREKNQLQK